LAGLPSPAPGETVMGGIAWPECSYYGAIGCKDRRISAKLAEFQRKSVPSVGYPCHGWREVAIATILRDLLFPAVPLLCNERSTGNDLAERQHARDDGPISGVDSLATGAPASPCFLRRRPQVGKLMIGVTEGTETLPGGRQIASANPHASDACYRNREDQRNRGCGLSRYSAEPEVCPSA
jgi:hypothetical protein